MQDTPHGRVNQHQMSAVRKLRSFPSHGTFSLYLPPSLPTYVPMMYLCVIYLSFYRLIYLSIPYQIPIYHLPTYTPMYLSPIISLSVHIFIYIINLSTSNTYLRTHHLSIIYPIYPSCLPSFLRSFLPSPIHPSIKSMYRYLVSVYSSMAVVCNGGLFHPIGGFLSMSRDIFGCHHWGQGTTGAVRGRMTGMRHHTHQQPHHTA